MPSRLFDNTLDFYDNASETNQLPEVALSEKSSVCQTGGYVMLDKAFAVSDTTRCV